MNAPELNTERDATRRGLKSHDLIEGPEAPVDVRGDGGTPADVFLPRRVNENDVELGPELPQVELAQVRLQVHRRRRPLLDKFVLQGD